MSLLRHLRRQAPLAASYFAAALLTITLTRFQGGVACLWFASAILIAVLLRTNRSEWGPALLACGAASFTATFVWGLGPISAGPFAIINLAEALVAAILLKRRLSGVRPLQSLSWFGRFIFAAGIAAPLVGGALAGGWFWIASLSKEPLLVGWDFFIGHSLGNLAMTPLAMLVSSSEARMKSWKRLSRRPLETLGLMLLVTAVVTLVFAQALLPLLFLPILPIILACFRVGREGAALAIALLALIGGILTSMGFGPVSMLAASSQWRATFFEFYLATTVLTVLPVSADLANRKRLVRRLRESEERYRILADFSTDIILKLDLDGTIRFVTPSIRQLGYHPDDLIGRNCAMLIVAEDLASAAEAHRRTLLLAGAVNRFEYRALSSDGSMHWFESSARMIVDDRGEFDGMVSIARNVADRKATEDRLKLAALTDTLTDLPNRRAFREKVESRIAASRSDSLALLDIDHFKQVNDRFGHDAGDEVLRAFAEAAKRVVRDGDMIARMGGEEFAVLFANTSVAEALPICERLREEISGTLIFAGDTMVQVTVSGGVAAISSDGLDQALKDADTALYRAKADGRDRLALAA